MSQKAFILCAGLAMLLALLFALWPNIHNLFRQRELIPRLPHALSMTLLALIPAVTILIYLQVGTYNAAEADDPRITLLRSQLIEMARELEKDPDQPEQWQRMGLVYKDLRHYGPAEHSLRRALHQRPDSAFLHVELAETLQLRSELPATPPEARVLLERAVDLEPQNLKALWMLATDDFLVGDYDTALAWWEQMLPLVPQDSSMHRAVRAQTRRARDLLSDQP
jgi:cytochrome c-type biogenesis protein CcmH